MATIQVDIVSAEGEIHTGEAAMVFAPAPMGEVGIAPRHAPMLTTLKPGEVRVLKPDSEELTFIIGGGILEVMPHLVTVLADTATRADDIDETAAQRAKASAERELLTRTDRMEIAEAQAKLAEAVAQLRALERLRRKLKRK